MAKQLDIDSVPFLGSTRLRELQVAGLVARAEGATWSLTALGRSLGHSTLGLDSGHLRSTGATYPRARDRGLAAKR